MRIGGQGVKEYSSSGSPGLAGWPKQRDVGCIKSVCVYVYLCGACCFVFSLGGQDVGGRNII